MKNKDKKSSNVEFTTAPAENDILYENKSETKLSKREIRRNKKIKESNRKIALDSNGVSFTYNENSILTKNAKIKIPVLDTVLKGFISIIASISAIMTLVTILEITVNTTAVIAVTVICSALVTFLLNITKKPLIVIPIIIILTAVIAGVYNGTFFDGCTVSFELARATIEKYMFWSKTVFSIDWSESLIPAVTLAISVFSVILTSFISFFSSYKTSFIGVFLFTFPCFEIGAAFGCIPNYYWFALMIASWAAVLTLSRSKMKIKLKGKSVKTNSSGVKGRFAGSAAFIAVTVFVLFLCCQWVITAMGITKSSDVADMRVSIKNKAWDIIDYITGNDNDGSLKEGKLYEMGDLNYKQRKYMNLEIPTKKITEGIYLRGYSATEYCGDHWEQFDGYGDTTLFAEMEKQNIQPVVMIGYVLSHHNDVANFGGHTTTISELRRKKKYAYTTYNAYIEKNYTENYDISMVPDNKNKYSYTSFPTLNYMFKITETDLYKSEYFKPYFQQYTDFVKQNYSSLPEGMDEVKMIVDSFNETNAYKIIDDVRSYLKENIQVSTKSKKSGKGNDFVTNLLFSQKSGYSAHFATAAAVMLRAANIPTRYVEGYYVFANDYNKTRVVNSDKNYDYTVTDKNSHAWIEIYDETYGWVPVDVTPGYYNSSFYDYMNSGSEQQTQKPQEETNINGEKDMNKPPVQNYDPHNEPDIRVKPVEPIDHTVIFLYVGIICAVLAFAISYIIIHNIIVRKQRKSISSSDSKQCILNCFDYLMWLIHYSGKSSYTTYSGLIDTICECDSSTDRTQATEIVSIFLECGFSDNPPEKSDAIFVKNYVIRYYARVYSGFKFFKKFKLKYILHKNI